MSAKSLFEILDNITVPNEKFCRCLACDKKETCCLGLHLNEIMFKFARTTPDILLNKINVDEIFSDFINTKTVNLKENLWKKFAVTTYRIFVNWIEERGMSTTDFFYNCALAYMDIQYSKIEEKSSIDKFLNNISYKYSDISRDKLSYRAKRAHKTKKDSSKYSVKKWIINKLYAHELELLLHEVILSEKEQFSERQNPLLKLANAENIDEHNFKVTDLQNIITYYKKMYKHIDTLQDMLLIEKALIIYHLEIEIRFETFIKILEKLKISSDSKKAHLKDGAKNNISKEYEDIKVNEARMFSGFTVQNYSKEISVLKNKVFYGLDKYIDRFIQADNSEHEKILNDMYEITKLIEVLTNNSIYECNEILLFDCDFISDLYAKTIANIITSSIEGDIGMNIKLKHFINLYETNKNDKNVDNTEM